MMYPLSVSAQRLYCCLHLYRIANSVMPLGDVPLGDGATWGRTFLASFY